MVLVGESKRAGDGLLELGGGVCVYLMVVKVNHFTPHGSQVKRFTRVYHQVNARGRRLLGRRRQVHLKTPPPFATARGARARGARAPR